MPGGFLNLHKNMGHYVNFAEGKDREREREKSTWDSAGMTTEATNQYVLFELHAMIRVTP